MNNSIVLLLCNFESTVVDTTINKVGTVDSKIDENRCKQKNELIQVIM